MIKWDDLGHKIVSASQSGIPLTVNPFEDLAKQVGCSTATLLERLQEMKSQGFIRRIAAIPNHYRMGIVANAMTVWDVVDERVDELGSQIGSLNFVTHCYRRPRSLPDWPYNLFAMIHGKSRDEVEVLREELRQILAPHLRGYSVLYSRRILKKSGFRLKREQHSEAGRGEPC